MLNASSYLSHCCSAPSSRLDQRFSSTKPRTVETASRALPAPHSLSLAGTLTAGHTCMRPRAATHRACFSYTYLSRFPLMTRKVCWTIKCQFHQITIARASFALACAALCAAADRSEMNAGDESQPRAANASSPFERASRRALVDVCVLFQFLGN